MAQGDHFSEAERLSRGRSCARAATGASIMNFHTYDAQLRAWQLPQEIDRLATYIAEADQQSDGQNQLWKYFGLTEVAKPPPETDVSDLAPSPVHRTLEEIKTEIKKLQTVRTRSSNPRDNPGVILEGLDSDEDDADRFSGSS